MQGQEQHESSFLFDAGKYAILGAATVAAIAFGGEYAEQALESYAGENPEGFMKETAASVGHGLGAASTFINSTGDKLVGAIPENWLSAEEAAKVNGKMVAAMAVGAAATGAAGLKHMLSGTNGPDAAIPSDHSIPGQPAKPRFL